MKRSPLTILIAALLIVIFGAMLFIFQVRQSEVAVVTVFDRLAPDGVQTNPGPHWQWPWPIAKVYKLDQRLHSMEDNSDSCLLHDDKIVLLLTYTGWRISDPVPVDFGQSLCYHGNRRVILCLGAAPMQPAAT